jgi:hypothetical protein
MTTDERLDKLTDRVDSLAHSVELLAGMQIASEQRVARLESAVATMADGIATLTRVALDHDDRIENLERR